MDLSAPLGRGPLAEVQGFDVSLREIDDEAYEELIRGLPRAFQGFERLLSIT